jgi:hypothetical protein
MTYLDFAKAFLLFIVSILCCLDINLTIAGLHFYIRNETLFVLYPAVLFVLLFFFSQYNMFALL